MHDTYTLTLNVPGWAVLLVAAMAVITVPLNLYRCWLEIKLARIQRELQSQE